ncbi:putative Transposase/IS110/IS902 family protein [Streptomyces viridochromogenes Tue57]|uniref:Putative Transposase/IS110/IS902 family protein n=1 Tax=Streptomyces viridochromogenes Tue57 TaxID=1160705 RepID=L8P5J5_STRVR|nr:putative Transposase/IS110/IS902 family protein [Streptomyces viridochromogenes Tue57]
MNPHHCVPAVEQVGLAPAGHVAAVLDEPVPVASTGER